MRRRRRLWIAVAAVPLLLLIADAVYWQFAARQLRAGFQAWMAAQHEAGWNVTAGPQHIGGWPIAAVLHVDGLTLKGGEADVPGGLDWHTGQLDLRVALWRPQILELHSAGPQSLRAGTGPAIAYRSEQMQAELPLQADKPPSEITLRARGLHADLPLRDGGSSKLLIAALQAHADLQADAGKDQPAVSFAVDATSITLPPAARWALGPQVAQFQIQGTLDGPLANAPDFTARAAAWRDGGGSLDIRHMALRWGKLDLSGTATLALDPQLQPMGAGTAKVVGYAETLDALAANGVLSRSAAVAAKAVLSLLAQAPQDGERDEVEVPLTLQYRTLSMRQVPLVRLPELDWPGR